MASFRGEGGGKGWGVLGGGAAGEFTPFCKNLPLPPLLELNCEHVHVLCEMWEQD